MMRRFGRANMVRAYEKSIVLGGGMVLYPVETANIPEMTKAIKKVIEEAEDAAYRAGYQDAKSEVREALGTA